ncbi:hypothetical protein CXQ85_001721 [Candidozyma haemuli]|uniref:Zn(2)-C6 fungal-type domain-containing protein n=1 Tax=Candidozyma haemuli TaxID=45357 RepID=A0A2V1AQE2_9ASCO|nr:hypothetical protein CXQ85_001721 [[Candida] haemuloni]PVH19944.1 hypothetical protein CXQ85_001721 [[Candida] haemuloni]
MAREKRTKPCSNCKRSKVKCEYKDSLPCTRCIKNGLASTCQIVPKLPSLTLPQVGPQSLPDFHMVPQVPHLPHHAKPFTHPPPPPLPGTMGYQPSPSQSNPPIPTHHHHTPPVSSLSPRLKKQEDPESQWKSHMENKLNSFESKFDNLVEALRGNQRYNKGEIEANQRYFAIKDSSSGAQSPYGNSIESTPDSSESERSYKRSSQQDYFLNKRRKTVDDDFRDSVLSLQEAKMLFKFFDTNISQQLFGFEIDKFQVHQIWENSPLLICAVCTIAAMHYPDPSISSKQAALQHHLHKLCSGLLFQPKPKSDAESFNIILALILCSFWLADSQRFTGLALQLAKEFGLNKPVSKSEDSASLSSKDRLKLWYLLYVLDGQQSMSLNRQSLFDSVDYSITNSRDLLLNKKTLEIKDGPEEEDKAKDDAVVHANSPGEVKTNAKETNASYFTDLRLVSQVEYNSAIREAFKGNAWDLIAPSTFGIPSKSNLELDKWMVSWTVLLAPVNNGAVWSSKSTLIYYNFAKMHINCSALRELQVETGAESVIFPKWERYHQLSQRAEPVAHQQKQSEPLDSEDSDDDEEDDLISNKELITHDQTLLSLNIAMNAAQTVLNLVLSDKDILNNLRYVPLHIHIMLYYAALLLVNPPPTDGRKIEDTKQDTYFFKIIESLRTAKLLQKKIYVNLPTDKSFGNRFIESLDDVVIDRTRRLKVELEESSLGADQKREIFEQISTLHFLDERLEVLPGSRGSSKESSPRAAGIAAWPGSHHGHP